MATKVVTKIEVTGLSGAESLKVLGGQGEPGLSCEGVDVTTMDDSIGQELPHPQPKDKPFKLKFAAGGAAMPTVGTAADVFVKMTYTDGTTRSVVKNLFVKDCELTEVDVGGNRVPAWDVTLQPTGVTATATTAA
jgi:hypothetical protein